MKIIKPGDFIPFLLTIGIIILIAVNVYKPSSGEPLLYIKSDEGEFLYPLDEDDEIKANGPLGASIVHIHQGEVSIADSPCPDKTCVNSTAISKYNEWNACLPNRVFIRIQSGVSGAGIDGDNSVDGGVDDLSY
ncbi:MAG: NusG domain II-containing protein [Spirochaetales bacterium]|nr:NusG domain II-containing protein [Spirochaetales bacterium]